MDYLNGDVYEGNWIYDKRNGKGKMTYVGGEIHEGKWINDQRHGVFTVTRPDGTQYIKTYSYDKPVD